MTACILNRTLVPVGALAAAAMFTLAPATDAAVLITGVDTDPVAVDGDAAVEWRGATGAETPSYVGSAGYSFTVGTSSITVTHLGVFDGPGNEDTTFVNGAVGDGLGDDAQVAIWQDNVTSAPVAVVTVPDDGGTLDDGFRYVDITDVGLLANTTYFIMAGYNGGSDGNVFTRYRSDAGTVGFNSSGVTIDTTTAYFSTSGDYNNAAYPAGTRGGTPHAGPNFQYLIPEPATLALMGLGGLAMLTRRRTGV